MNTIFAIKYLLIVLTQTDPNVLLVQIGPSHRHGLLWIYAPSSGTVQWTNSPISWSEAPECLPGTEQESRFAMPFRIHGRSNRSTWSDFCSTKHCTERSIARRNVWHFCVMRMNFWLGVIMGVIMCSKRIRKLNVNCIK